MKKSYLSIVVKYFTLTNGNSLHFNFIVYVAALGKNKINKLEENINF